MASIVIFVPVSPNESNSSTIIVLPDKDILSVSPFSVNDQVIDVSASGLSSLTTSLVADKINVLDTNNSWFSSVLIVGSFNLVLLILIILVVLYP